MSEIAHDEALLRDGGSAPTTVEGEHKQRISTARVVNVLALSMLLPLGLYVVLRPENYGLTPNFLDPVFYSGFSINFDDVLAAVFDRHYFVSRWSAYLPMYVADSLFGPVAGRLLWRLALASLILLSLWALGRRWQWTTAQRLLIGTVVLSTPIFVRAFFTDYVEYLIVALGICLICLCLRTRHRWWSAMAVGAVAGLIVIANPVSITFVVFPLAAAVVLGARGVKERAWFIAVVGSGTALVGIVGLLSFRWRYGIQNVYWPTVAFVRDYRAPEIDPYKPPGLDWLGSFTWIYAAPVLVLIAIGLSVKRVVRFDRVEIAAFALCGSQFLYECFDRFVRGGWGLQISYYWSYTVPSILVATAVLIGRLSSGVRGAWLATIGIGWVGLLLVGVPDVIDLPAGLGFAVLALAAIGTVVLVAPRSTVAGLSIMLVFLAWMQIGAPHWDRTYLSINLSPKYDQLYRQAGNESETVYDEAVWFEQRMDQVPNDATASFVSAGGWSPSIIALYAPQVTGHWLEADASGSLSPIAQSEIERGTRPLLALLGPPAQVEKTLQMLADDLGVGTVLLDETHDSALGYRLVVLSTPNSSKLPFTWTGDMLPTLQGELVGTEVISRNGDPGGIVTSGRYGELAPGRYRAEYSYRSSLPPSSSAGLADVNALPSGTIGSADLPGTNGATGTKSIDFTVDADQQNDQWEFRVFRGDAGEMVVENITLRRI